MTAPSASYDGDRNLRIIRARCSDVLSDDGINALMQPDLPVEISDLLLQALDEIAARLDRIEQDVTMEDDDANQPSYRRRA